MRILYLLIFLCLIVSTAFVFRESYPPQLEYEDIPKKHTLDNGLTVIIKSSHKIPMVAIRLVIRTGSAREGSFAGSGVSHFVEHMLFKGTAYRAADEIERRIKSYGGTINASTSLDTTEVYLTVMSKHLKESLELVSDFVFRPLFNETEFERERQVILNEIRMKRDDPGNRASVLLWETAYLSHPYRYPVIGYETLFNKLERDDLVKYHAANYVPNNCVLSIVGDVDVSTALNSVKDTFGRFERKADPQIAIPKEQLQMSTRTAEEELSGLELSHAIIAFHSTALTDADLYPLDVLAAVLGQGESSRLNGVLVRDKRLAHSVSAYNYTPKEPGLFIIIMTLDENKIDAALAEALYQIEKARRHPLLWGELGKIKRSVITGYIYSKESIEAQTDDYASSYTMTGDYDFSRRYLEGVKSVTAKDVLSAAKKYLKPENMTIAIVKPEGRALSKAAATAQKKKQFDIKKVCLPNGATLLMHEDSAFPIVSINILFKGGVRYEDPRINGISHLFSDMLLKGTSRHSAEWIARATESRGIALSAFSGRNSFGLSVKCLKDDFDFSLKLISEILNRANFPEKEIDLLKEIQLAAIKAQDENIFSTASKTLIGSIFKTHPYGMPEIGTPLSVRNIKRKDLQEYYRRFALPDNAVIAVFGDIKIKEAESKLSRIFGNMKSGRFKEVNVPAEPEQAEPRQSVKYVPKEQTVLMIGYPGIDIKNPDKYILDVINSILSREGGRLSAELRQKLGLSYTQGSFSVLGLDPGFNAFYVATSYENAQEAQRVILNQIKSLKVEGPTQQEMVLAKSDLVGEYYRGLEVNSEFGFQAGLDELYGLGYDEIFKYPQMIEAVTAKDVMRVAKQYFADSKSSIVIIAPALKASPATIGTR